MLAWRLNVNWDEFYFLNHVYALTRGELTLLLQGSYTHAFTWLTHLPGHEVDQVVAGRLVMVALLALTAWLVWRLARLWMHGLASALPPFVFLTFMPVLEHGGSFRADSILAPLSVAALLVLLSTERSSRGDWLAGAILGVAFAVTVKVVLFAPLVFFAILYRGSSVGRARLEWVSAALTMARVGAAAAHRRGRADWPARAVGQTGRVAVDCEFRGERRGDDLAGNALVSALGLLPSLLRLAARCRGF